MIKPLHFGRRSRSFALVLALGLLLQPTLQAASHYKVLYRFTAGTDGAYPNSLVLDGVGNLYGTTDWGGYLGCSSGFPMPGCGVVFELTPSGGGRWQEKVLYAFQGGTDGIAPSGNLVFDRSGNLYGITYGGGGTILGCYTGYLGCGTVFELSPHADGTWTETVLYRFQNQSDGGSPSGLIFDASGNLYGVSSVYVGSAIFELSPPQQEGAPWTETTIYSTGKSYTWVSSDLVFDPQGNLYGTWYPSGCCGGVFELKYEGQSWQESDLYDFLGGGNGGEPMSGIIFDTKGNMYGTGIAGGNDWGIAFELKLVGGQWAQVMLHNFCRLNGCADGAWPYAGLLFDQVGNLYGTTAVGGTGCSGDGCGVVFKLTPAKRGKWTETVLHSFKGGLDGYSPYEAVTLDGKGHIFGTAAGGTGCGHQGCGIVFEVTP